MLAFLVRGSAVRIVLQKTGSPLLLQSCSIVKANQAMASCGFQLKFKIKWAGLNQRFGPQLKREWAFQGQDEIVK